MEESNKATNKTMTRNDAVDYLIDHKYKGTQLEGTPQYLESIKSEYIKYSNQSLEVIFLGQLKMEVKIRD